jgi:hypothetical protein
LICEVKEMVVPVNDVELGVWRKSSHSGAGNDCVELARFDAGTAVRDSKNPDGPRLAFDPAPWTAFLASARS